MDINPDTESQVGVWRDGRYIVLHCQAELPPICVLSGQPACHHRRQTIGWHTNWHFDKRRLDVPLGDRGIHDLRTLRRWALAFALVGLLLALAFGLLGAFGRKILFLLGLAGIWCVASAAGVFLDTLRLLKVVRVRDEYLWLKGAGEDFLNRLPEWPWEKIS